MSDQNGLTEPDSDKDSVTEYPSDLSPARSRSWSRKLKETAKDYRIVDMPLELRIRLYAQAKARKCSMRELVLLALTLYVFRETP